MKTLIITDVQNDFMPGGSLGIKGANAIIPLINRLIPHFEHVFAVLDWHPKNHVSFASVHNKKPGDTIRIGSIEQILWPDHCIQNTKGADLADGLHREKIEAVFHKGVDPKVDSYSTFYDNRLLSKFALVEEIDDFSADFCAERGRHTQRVGDEQGQKFAKKGDLNSQMEFRKKSNARRRSTGLYDHLKKLNLKDLYFVGVATDYCILYSVIDALSLGFQATVIRDACRPIHLQAGDEEKALSEMSQKGAQILLSDTFFKQC